ncbi:MAG: PAS domain S-box protein, partial [Deltaproteobacteria bacterium]|nr:PAS domain S-box protein [Deltaproteobacteria bacterium]
MGTGNNQTKKKNLDRELRNAAQVKLTQCPAAPGEIEEKTLEEIIHKFRVHQIELEIQNEGLRKAQNALEASRQKYENYYDVALMGYFTLTRGALIKEASLTSATLLGVARQKLINCQFRWFIANSDLDLWDRHFLSVSRQGEKQTGELMLKRQDGSTFQASLESIRMEENRGAFEVHTEVTDINVRKRIEESIRLSEERYRTVIEEIDEGYYEVDLVGNFTFVNDSIIRHLQYSRDELIGRNYRTYIPQDQLERIYQTFNRAYRTGEIVKWCPVTIIRKDGTPIFAEDSISCLKDREGKIIGFRGISRDITERKQTGKELKQTLENLRKAMGGIIQAISLTVEARDPYTSGHQRRVADLARSIAQRMGLSENQVDGLRMAANVHDLGKIAVPAEILSKPTKLNSLEFQLIKIHPQTSYDILKDIDFPWPVAQIVFQHHER